MMAAPVSTRDLFAELYVAGLMADAGWHLYFPKRDYGLDFIATKEVDGNVIIRPVQVKGLYPTATKTDKAVYGYRGRLTQVHPEMVLALPFFPVTREPSPISAKVSSAGATEHSGRIFSLPCVVQGRGTRDASRLPPFLRCCWACIDGVTVLLASAAGSVT